MEGNVDVSDDRRRKQTRLTDFWNTKEIMEDYVRLGNKRPRISDRLSELPESLLIQIISLLEMKEAVKTGLLSKRWKLLWTQVDRISYKGIGEKQHKRIYGQFVSFVDHTLMQCTSSRIKEFRFKSRPAEFSKKKTMHRVFDKWLTFILQKNVEIFNLYLNGFEYSVPNCLYRNSSLIKLKLGDVSVSVSSPVSWRFLRSLKFDSVQVDEESFANILLGCPVLETIELGLFWGIKNLNIMSPSVKKLILRCPLLPDDSFFKLNAPWLHELDFGDQDFLIRHFQLVDISSLKSAQVCFYYNEDWRTRPNGLWWNEMVHGLFKCLCHVAELTIGTKILQALAASKLLGKPYPLLKCKHMTVILPLRKCDLYGIACLLQNTPYLETLLIRVTDWQEHMVMPYPKEIFDRREQEMSLPEGNLMHLKNVKIQYEKDCGHSPTVIEDGTECLDVQLVLYILRITPDLKTLVILSSGGHWEHQWCFKCGTRCASQLAPLLYSKLLLKMNETLEWELVQTKSAFEFRFSNHKPVLTKE